MERKKREVTKTMERPKVLGMICILALLTAAVHAAPGGDPGDAYGNTRFNTQGLDFAVGVTRQSLKAAPLQKDTPPGDEWPAHIEFKFPHYFDGKLGKLLTQASGESPLLAIYPTADFAAIQWEGELKSLKALLKKRSGGNRILAAAKTLRADIPPYPHTSPRRTSRHDTCRSTHPLAHTTAQRPADGRPYWSSLSMP